MTCELCKGLGWVCEYHKNQPFLHDNCSGAGDPCICNTEFEHKFSEIIAEVDFSDEPIISK